MLCTTLIYMNNYFFCKKFSKNQIIEFLSQNTNAETRCYEI